MRDHLPTIGMLVAFDAVMGAGGFARAAARLNLTPAAVSYQVKSLERLIGASLFERHADRVVPTALARELAVEGTRIIHRARRFRDRGATLARRTMVRVLAAQTLASLWLLPRINDLIASFPDRQFEIMSWLGGTTRQRIGTPGTELHIEIRWAQSEELPRGERSLLIAPDSAIPVCTPEYRVRYRDLGETAAQRRLTLIHPLNWPKIWDRWSSHALGRRLNGMQEIHFQNSALCVQAAASGVGIAIAHSALIETELASGKLVRAHVDALDLEESYYAVDKSGADVVFFDQFVMWCRRNMPSLAAGVIFEGRDRSRDPGVGNVTLT